MEKVYLLVTMDDLELPIGVFDSPEELARHEGVTVSTVRTCIWKAKKRGGRCKYVMVNVDDDEQAGN